MNLRPETLKLLEKNREEPFISVLAMMFLDWTPKAKAIKAN